MPTKERYWKNPERYRKEQKIYNKKHRAKPRINYGRYKQSAKIREISFMLTVQEFISFEDKHCFYCNTAMSKIGLDRVDNSRGYTLDNVVSCCSRCNRMKGILSQDDFKNHCKLVAIVMGKQ